MLLSTRIPCRVWLSVFLLASTSMLFAQDDIAEKTRRDPDYQQGKAALLAGQYADAKRYLELVEGRIGPDSAEINAGIALAELQMGHFAAARHREGVVLTLVSNPHARAEAHNIIGTAWLREAQQNGGAPDQVHAAEQSFRDAVKADPEFAAPYYDLGELLLHEGRTSDAASAFHDFVRASAEDPTLIRDMPDQAIAHAPDFRVVDSHGNTISLASLRGRVVLLDFWATWCPPCIRALPVMRELAHYFPDDKFLLISLDEDVSEAELWKQFISKQNMDWTQVWDHGSAVYNSFGLGGGTELSLPRYVLIDRNGNVLRVYSGTDRLGSVVGHAIRLTRGANNSGDATSR